MADRAGISRQTLKRIEKGDTLAQPHTIEAVAKVLGANPAPLLKLRDRAHHNRAKTLRRRLNDGREP